MSRTLWVLTLFIELLSPCIVMADEPDPKVMKSWVEYYKEIARSYEIGLRSAPNTFLTVVETPVLVYSNPTSGRDTHGAIFIWTRNGRAEVKSLRVEYNGETVWENTERNLGSQRAKYYSVTATTRLNEIK